MMNSQQPGPSIGELNNLITSTVLWNSTIESPKGIAGSKQEEYWQFALFKARIVTLLFATICCWLLAICY